MSFGERWREIRTGFQRSFWVANFTELFERLAYYGLPPEGRARFKRTLRRHVDGDSDQLTVTRWYRDFKGDTEATRGVVFEEVVGGRPLRISVAGEALKDAEKVRAQVLEAVRALK